MMLGATNVIWFPNPQGTCQCTPGMTLQQLDSQPRLPSMRCDRATQHGYLHPSAVGCVNLMHSAALILLFLCAFLLLCAALQLGRCSHQ